MNRNPQRFFSGLLSLSMVVGCSSVLAQGADSNVFPSSSDSKQRPFTEFVAQDRSENIVADRDASFGEETTGMVTAGRDVSLSGTTVTGDVHAGRQLAAEAAKVQGNLMAGRDVQLRQCDVGRNIMAGRDLKMMGSQVKKSVKAARTLTLIQSTIQGNASSGNTPAIHGSVIHGTLNTASDYLHINGSNIGRIHVSDTNGAFSSGSHLSIHNSSVVGGRNGKLNVRVSSGGVSRINNYTIVGHTGKTTVMTPEGQTYENGRLISGDGPTTYGAYAKTVSSAPHIQGPGWKNNPAPSKAAAKKGDKAEESDVSAVTQVIELSGQTVIQSDIVFDSGHGKVILNDVSAVHGKIIGGVLEDKLDQSAQ